MKSRKRKSDQFGDLLTGVQAQNPRALAQMLTWVEQNQGAKVLSHQALAQSAKPAFRIGITGPPGAGKSTLVGGLIKELRAKGLQVAVLAVDPSSPFSHGAILGDRIRYNEHVLDEGVFIRSLGTRGSLGGLSASAYLMLRVFDAAEFDVVLIETVGVGQTELEVMHVADTVAVVLVPESGDSVQAMKAGLLEIADVFVVNKSDRPGAPSLVKELEFIAETAPADRPKPEILSTVALNGEGVQTLAKALLKRRESLDLLSLRKSRPRLQHEARALMRASLEARLEKRLKSVKKVADIAKLLKFALMFLIFSTGCAVGPLVSHETARTVGWGHSELVGGIGQAGYVLKWNYGLSERVDFGIHWESLSIGLRIKFGFSDNKGGWAFATALGTGTSLGGSHYYGDLILSHLSGQWEPYGTLRLVHVKNDPLEFRDQDTGGLNFTIGKAEYDYGQALVGSRFWISPNWLFSMEASSLFSLTPGFKLENDLLLGAALGYRF